MPDPARRPAPPTSIDATVPLGTVAHGADTVDLTRPFGAHVRLLWWQPLLLGAAIAVCLLGFQLAAWAVVGVIEGSDDPFSSEFTPLKSAAANLSIAATGVVAVLLLMRMTGASWRLLLSPRRAFDRRRLVHYLAAALPLVAAGLATMGLVAPEATPWTAFGISGTTVALLAVTLLTTPLQAAGEELTYRGVLLPAAASWVRATRPALALGLAVSVVVFAAAHGATDPWLAGYFALIAVCTGLMAILSRGLEASIAFHVVNNVLLGVVNNVMAAGGTSTVDRSTETGGPPLLILAAMNVCMLVIVWLHERRAARRRRSAPGQAVPSGTGQANRSSPA
ncbi:type II CAAX prenyl endopeptidase Rce1 family protein [Pseudonocardia spirodelae]|uniref:CPBP family glutamic-type intramembrane protease n=1 Tax=Pseudonocardia spirodelae TaxID=3133431 RepID=A0ABU8TAB1_9PSEU